MLCHFILWTVKSKLAHCTFKPSVLRLSWTVCSASIWKGHVSYHVFVLHVFFLPWSWYQVKMFIIMTISFFMSSAHFLSILIFNLPTSLCLRARKLNVNFIFTTLKYNIFRVISDHQLLLFPVSAPSLSFLLLVSISINLHATNSLVKCKLFFSFPGLPWWSQPDLWQH